MKTIKFKVQGSNPEPYTVTFVHNEDTLTAFCTCEAGENGIHCKHRLRILNGISENIVSENIKDIEIILSWLPGTRLESAINSVKIAEINILKAKKSLSSAKHELSSALHGR